MKNLDKGLYFVFFSDEMEKIKIPKDMDDAKALGTVLSKYKDTYYTQVLVAYFATYVLYPWRKCVLPITILKVFPEVPC